MFSSGEADSLAEAASRMEAGAALDYDTEALVEEFLDGREITVSVLGNYGERQVLPITETPKHIGKDYLTLEDKFLPGGAEMITPAELDESIAQRARDVAVKVCDTLRLIGYPRIDMIVMGERITVLEPNVLPGITPSTMVGVAFPVCIVLNS